MSPRSPRKMALLAVLCCAACVPIVSVAGGKASGATTATNLVTNPSMETIVNGFPSCFEKSGYGGSTATWSVLNTGHTGAHSVKLTLASYTSGDRKAMMTESTACAPRVTAGHQYDLSEWYESTTAAISLTVFRHTSAGWTYWTDLKTLPASSTWKQALARTPAVPTGTDQLTFGMSQYGNGSTTVDDFAATDATVVTGGGGGGGGGTGIGAGTWTVLPINNTVRSIHSILLNNGKVLMMAGSGNDPMAFAAGTFKSTVYDPTTNTFTAISTPADMFCSGHVQLPNGNVLVMGGNKAYPSADGTRTYEGLKSSYIFNVATNTYGRVNDLNTGHWYPSATELGNGDIFSIGGLDENAEGTVTNERFSVAQNAWLPYTQVGQSWSYYGLYPTMVLMQDGRLFYTGAHAFGDNVGTGASIFDPNSGAITDITGLRAPNMRDQAMSVLLPPAQNQKVATFGGGNINGSADAINLTDEIDLSAATPQYVAGPNLPSGTWSQGNSLTPTPMGMEPAGDGKMYVSATILPDGNVLESAGGLHNRADPVQEASLFNPVTNSFTSTQPDPVNRIYHNEAILLPDGRVLEVGSNPGDGSFEMRMSVYSPWYMSQPRPTITSLGSTSWAYGSTQAITTDSTIASAVLIRPEAVTHDSDPNQRSVDLPLTVVAGTTQLNMPSNPNLAPPGYYMLFVRNAAGVPSVAKWVHVG